MRNWSYLAVIVVLIVIGIVYWGGVIKIGDSPLFYLIDQKLGTTCFMGSHNRLMNVFQRGPESNEPDPFTRPYQDFNNVLKQTSE